MMVFIFYLIAPGDSEILCTLFLPHAPELFFPLGRQIVTELFPTFLRCRQFLLSLLLTVKLHETQTETVLIIVYA